MGGSPGDRLLYQLNRKFFDPKCYRRLSRRKLLMTPPSINISEALKDDRQLKSLIGLGRDEFEKLLNEFTSFLKDDKHKNRKGKSKKHRQRKIGGGRKSALGSPENQLAFILFYLKSYPTYDVLAFTFNISRGCAFESVQRLLPILKQTQKN